MTEHTTEMQIGNTLFIITSECSDAAVETVEQKLERIISRHILDAEKLSETYQNKPSTGVAMC